MDLHTPWGGSERLELVGSCTIETTWDGVEPGSAGDDDGNGLDEVSTEIVALSLRGTSSMGLVTMTLGTVEASLGGIEELVNLTPGLLDLPTYTPPPGSPANSFFDVYVDVELGDNRTHNQEPLRMTGSLSSLPAAHTDDLAGVGVVPLYDENAEPTGIAFEIERWTLNPIVEVDVFDSANAAITVYDPMGMPHMVALNGQARVDVIFTGGAEGLDEDSDGDGLDDASMKLVMLDLTGYSPVLGDVSLVLGNGEPSLGAIEETANFDPGRLDLPPFAAGGTADSFFDVFTELTAGEHVRATVYDPMGRRIATLADRRFEAGANVLDWQGRDDTGRAMPSGVYLVRVSAGTADLSGRLVLVR